MSSISGLKDYAATLVTVNSMANEMTTWNHVMMILLEESKQQARNEKICKETANSADNGLIASSSSLSRAAKKRRGSYIRCYNCNQTGHEAGQGPRRRHPTAQESPNVDQRRYRRAPGNELGRGGGPNRKVNMASSNEKKCDKIKRDSGASETVVNNVKYNRTL